MAKPPLDDPKNILHLVKDRRVKEEKAIAASKEKKSESAYFLDSDGLLCRTKATKDGKVTVRLCNFQASITEENIIDDGSSEVTHLYAIEGKVEREGPSAKAGGAGKQFCGHELGSQMGYKSDPRAWPDRQRLRAT